MGYQVLIVEDDHALADVLNMKLAKCGHGVTIARHQLAAYHLLDEKEFDLVLLDLRLPINQNDMDPNIEVGFTILDYIRERFFKEELPVIVMTAYEETSQTAVRALKALANDYIQKPFDDSPVSFDQKLKEITQYLEQSRRVADSGINPPLEKRHKIVFKKGWVEINGIKVTNRHYELLLVLGSRTFMVTPDTVGGDGTSMTGNQIAKALKVAEPTVRQYIARFRKWIAQEHERIIKMSIGDQDIIRNTRDWSGYELNFDMAFITRE